MAEHIITGQRAEHLACEYLRKQGLHLVAQNFRSRYGEIDLIMQDRDMLAFIEVRYRNNVQYGGGIESVDWHKQQKIVKTAASYLQQQKQLMNHPCRFDVVSIGSNIENTFTFEWIKNAFQDESGF